MQLLGRTNLRQERVTENLLGDGDGQAGSDQLPTCVEPLKFLVALPLQRFDILPRVLLLERSICLGIVDHHTGQLSPTGNLAPLRKLTGFKGNVLRQ